MAFDFEDVTDTSAKVVLHWEKLKVPFTVEVDTPKLVADKAKDAVRWQTPLQAANYCIQNNTCLDDAGRWLDASIALQENFSNLRAKAMLLAKKNDSKGAVDLRREGPGRREDRPAGAEPPAGQGAGGDGRGVEEVGKPQDQGATRRRTAAGPLRQPGPSSTTLFQAGERVRSPAAPRGRGEPEQTPTAAVRALRAISRS